MLQTEKYLISDHPIPFSEEYLVILLRQVVLYTGGLQHMFYLMIELYQRLPVSAYHLSQIPFPSPLDDDLRQVPLYVFYCSSKLF